MLKNIFFFLMLGFFVRVVFFYWKEIENVKTTNVTVSVIQFRTKRCLFQPSRSKTIGKNAFLVAKVQFFRGEGETHRNITILTMCKIST